MICELPSIKAQKGADRSKTHRRLQTFVARGSDETLERFEHHAFVQPEGLRRRNVADASILAHISPAVLTCDPARRARSPHHRIGQDQAEELWAHRLHVSPEIQIPFDSHAQSLREPTARNDASASHRAGH